MINQNPELSPILNPSILSYTTYFGNKKDVDNVIQQIGAVGDLDDDIKLNLADSYCIIGNPKSAKRVFYSIPFSAKQRFPLKYMAVESEVLESNGDYAGALKAYQEYYTTHDSTYNHIFENNLLFAQQRHEMEKSNLLEIQRRNTIIWICVCAAFILLIVAGFLFYHNRLNKAKKLMAEQENEKLMLKQENLKRENENLELERQQQQLVEDNLRETNRNLELERQQQSLVEENLRFRIGELEGEIDSLNEVLKRRDYLAEPIQKAITGRIEMLNDMLASLIAENGSFKKNYEGWRARLIQDKDEFMDSTRLAFKASHPKFIAYLEEHGLTDSEINYCCLYAIGLKGKEIGDYMQRSRHFHLAGEIRKKFGFTGQKPHLKNFIINLLSDEHNTRT